MKHVLRLCMLVVPGGASILSTTASIFTPEPSIGLEAMNYWGRMSQFGAFIAIAMHGMLLQHTSIK